VQIHVRLNLFGYCNCDAAAAAAVTASSPPSLSFCSLSQSLALICAVLYCSARHLIHSLLLLLLLP
jgi:hypothetical protein